MRHDGGCCSLVVVVLLGALLVGLVTYAVVR